MGHRTLTIAILLGFCGVAVGADWDSPIDRKYRNKNPQLYAQTDEARSLLDGYRGEEETLADAQAILATVTRSDSTFAPALREASRAFIMAAHSDGHRYETEYMSIALGLLEKAIAVEPAYADAYVLLGHLYTEIRDFEKAEVALRRGESLGTQSPWLDLNWADLRVKFGDDAGAEVRYRAALARGTKNAKAYTAALRGLRGIHWRRGELDQVEAMHRKLVAFEPTDPSALNGYAWFKLTSRGDFDGAIAMSESALEIRDHVGARFTLGCALLTKLARAIERGDEGPRSEALWVRANSLGHSTGRLVEELHKHPATKSAADVLERLAQ